MRPGELVFQARLLCRTLGALWVPPQCPSCYVRIDSTGVCDSCFKQLLEESPPFESELTVGADSVLPGRRIRLWAGGRYEGIWRNLVQSYKTEPVSPFPDWVRRRFESLGRDGGCNPVLLPVPMHRVRRRERGVNPSEILAEGLAGILDWELDASALERARYRRPLRGLSAAARKQEMIAAVRLRPGAAKRLRGRAVWVVDDVLTTGSTLDACFQAIAKADISGMGAVVLAWAPLVGSEPERPFSTDPRHFEGRAQNVVPGGARDRAGNERECTRKL